MLRFAAARIAQSIITLIVLSMVVFFGAELTGDIALAMATPDTTRRSWRKSGASSGWTVPPTSATDATCSTWSRATWECRAPVGARSAR